MVHDTQPSKDVRLTFTLISLNVLLKRVVMEIDKYYASVWLTFEVKIISLQPCLHGIGS